MKKQKNKFEKRIDKGYKALSGAVVLGIVSIVNILNAKKELEEIKEESKSLEE